MKENFVDITELMRSIQRSEGHQDCFRRKASCDEMGCVWRSLCLEMKAEAEAHDESHWSSSERTCMSLISKVQLDS